MKTNGMKCKNNEPLFIIELKQWLLLVGTSSTGHWSSSFDQPSFGRLVESIHTVHRLNIRQSNAIHSAELFAPDINWNDDLIFKRVRFIGRLLHPKNLFFSRVVHRIRIRSVFRKFNNFRWFYITNGCCATKCQPSAEPMVKGERLQITALKNHRDSISLIEFSLMMVETGMRSFVRMCCAVLFSLCWDHRNW